MSAFRSMTLSAQAPRAPVSKVVAATASLVIGVGGAWVLRTFDPGSPSSLFPPCMFHVLTGLHCPGCGITRALHALVHGDLVRAWAMNPLLLFVLPALGWMLAQWLSGRTLLPVPLNRYLHDGRAWIAVLLAFGLLRNLPFAPFAWMAPG